MRPRPTLVRAALLAALLVASLLWSGSIAHAQDAAGDDAAAIGLRVTAGFDGRNAGAPWVPIEVVVEPSRLVAGVLEVVSSGGVVERREIEVAAGSRKVYRFVVSATQARAAGVGVGVAVRLQEPGRNRRLLDRAEAHATGEFLMGVLESVPPGAPPLQHLTGAAGSWVAVAPQWLEVAPEALRPLSALVVERTALAAVPEEGRRNLATAVAHGMDLVVIADRDGPLDLAALGLPWEPARSAVASVVALPGPQGKEPESVRTLDPAEEALAVRAGDIVAGAGGEVIAAAQLAGRGRVVVVGVPVDGGRLAERLWSQLAGPRPRAALGERGAEGHWLSSLFRERGAGEAPSLPWLAAFLLAYVAVVGPMNGLVLARLRRRELAWITVPVVTVVFTAGAFVGAVAGRPPVGMAGRLLAWVDGTGVEVVAAAARAPTEGAHTVALPGSGWVLQSVAGMDGGVPIARDENTTAELELGALTLGGLVARRPITQAPPLVVEARHEEATTVSVRNASGRVVHDVVVHAATHTRSVGDLAPGDARTVNLGHDPLPLRPMHEPLEELGLGLPRSVESLLLDLRDGSPGLIWAIGTSEGFDPAVRVDGRAPRHEGSVVAVGVRPTVEAVVPRTAVERAAVTTGRAEPTRGMVLLPEEPAFLRFRLPRAVARVHSELRRGQGRPGAHVREFAVWNPQRQVWRPHGEAFPGQTGQAGEVVNAFGEVWVRVAAREPFEYSGRAIWGVAR